MGKPTGFLDFKRDDGPARPPGERIADWNEFHPHRPDKELQTQGARCMDCGTPFLPHRSSSSPAWRPVARLTI